MKVRPLVLAITAVIGLGAGSAALVVAAPRASVPAVPGASPSAGAPANAVQPNVQSVEFFGMPAPSTPAEKAGIYTKAKVRYTYVNGKTEDFDLVYHQLMGTTDSLNGKVIGGLYDVDGKPLNDKDGQMASDAADGTSLLDIPGMKALNPATARPLALVVNFEYKELPPNSQDVLRSSHWSRLPAVIGVAKLDQDKKTGALVPVDYNHVDFSQVGGGWIHCGSTPSSWGTHVSSEEYEPDARVREIRVKDATIDTNAEVNAIKAPGSDDATDIDSFSHYYFGDGTAHVPDPASPADPTKGTLARSTIANPYHYGLVPEVTVDRDGKGTVVKHYAPGRYAREMIEFASDGRTHIGGDDGKNTALFMFVADKAEDLSAGTLYAAKVTQTSADNGGSYDLLWIRLGHATNAEIEALVARGIKFSDIFDASNVDPSIADPAKTGYAKVTTYMGTEWLKLKPGMDKAAAFLESRRYAALMGATTEFSKMEYIAFNEADRKFYLTISRVEQGMADASGDIQVARNDGGIILEMSTAKGQTDKSGASIDSEFVGTKLASIPDLVGGWPIPVALDTANGGTKDGKDAEGNQCVQDKPCGPDNLRYVDSIRTLFIGEDTSRRNNNYVWAYNIDTKKLSRILSVPMAAEATGLTIVPNQNGFAYITSNFQHPGEDNIKNYTGSDKTQVLELLNKKWNNRTKAAIGYIGIAGGALPAMK
jgi:secreted PhoX family phosphatase